MVDGRKQRAIGTCGLHVLRLHGGRRNMLLMCPGLFLGGGSRGSPTIAAIEAYSSYGGIVDDGFVVDVGDVDAAEIVDGPVVREDAVSPVAALVAGAHIAETVIDAAVESDMRPPISGVPNIEAISPAPISWSPEQADGRRLNPGSRYPVVTLGTVCPEAGCPDVARAGNFGLIVDRQLRRRDRHINVYHLRRRIERQTHRGEGEKKRKGVAKVTRHGSAIRQDRPSRFARGARPRRLQQNGAFQGQRRTPEAYLSEPSHSSR